MNGNAWTSDEITKLRRLYPSAPWSVIYESLAPHSQRSISKTASNLGLSRRRTKKKSKYGFINLLWMLRDDKRLARKYLAGRVGVSEMMLSRWERGESNPSLGNVGKWCDALGVELVPRTSLANRKRERAGFGKNIATPASPLYLSVVEQIRRRIAELGVSFSEVEHRSGLHDGYLSKILNPDDPGGKEAGWYLLNLVCEALWGGVMLEIVPKDHDLGDRSFIGPEPKHKPKTPVGQKTRHSEGIHGAI